jgi:hypothetical protein
MIIYNIIFLTGTVVFLSDLINVFRTDTENMLNDLTKYNIEEVFDRTPTDYHHRHEFDFKIYQKTIETKTARYQVFKIVKNNETEYIASEFKTILGNGGFGKVYEGISVITGKIIVLKRVENVHNNEIECLKKVGTYIASTWNTILMEKAEGISYQDILTNKSISDERKITLHKKILKKIVEFHERYHILHNDMKPAHIFIDVNENITFIDFGLSENYDSGANGLDSLNRNIKKDIDNLNQVIEYYYFSNCGILFRNHINTFNSNESMIKSFFNYFFQRSKL